MTRAPHELEGWKILETLGRGGMCVVYRAHPRGEPDRERAIKVLEDRHRGAAERFLREGRLLAQLRHPNIVHVEAVSDGDPPWMVMELLTGRDLEARLEDGDPVEPTAAARWIADVAQGLGAAHAAGVLHRDIKPSNIMLGADGVPRLIDFGVARQRDAARLTADGVVLGTAAYLPPEVFLQEGGNRLQDAPQADVYALGQTLAELLLGRPLHPPPEVAGPHVLVQIMRDKIDAPYIDPRLVSPEVPEALAAIVIDATRVDPAQRIPDAHSLERRLRAFLGEPAPPPRPAPVVMPTDRASDLTPTDAPLLPRAALGLGAAGLFGLLAAGVLAAGIAAVAALWLALPGPAERALDAALRAQLERDGPAIQRCFGGAVRLELVVSGRGGRPVDLSVQGAEPDAARCVARQLASWTVPDGGPVRLRVIVHPASPHSTSSPGRAAE